MSDPQVLQARRPDRLGRPGRKARPGRRAIQVPYLDLQALPEVKGLLATQGLPALRAWLDRLDRKAMLALPAQRGRREVLALPALKGISARQGPPERRETLARPGLPEPLPRWLARPGLRALSGRLGRPALPLRRGLVSKVIPTRVMAQQRHLQQRAGLHLCLFWSWKTVFRKYQQAITRCRVQILFSVLRQRLVLVSIFVC